MFVVRPRVLPSPRSRPQQDQSIQALRGIAVLLLVTFHVVGDTKNSGLRLDPGSALNYFDLALADIRMPLFTLISGYAYAMVPVAHWRDYPQLLRGKSRRLLLPLITVGTVLYIVKCNVPGLNSGDDAIAFWRVFVFRFEYLWFLQSIFIVFVVVGILDGARLLASRTRWTVVTVVTAVVFIVVVVPPEADVFTLSGALKLLPFFLLGYGMRRHALFDLRGVPAVTAATVAFAGLYAIRMMTITGAYRPDRYVDKAIAVGVGATALILVYSARNVLKSRLLAWIGGFSFGIYLLHVFATAGSRIFLEHVFGMYRVSELFIVGLVMGIGAPIVFQLLFGRIWLVKTFVLGERSAGRHVRRRRGSSVGGYGAIDGARRPRDPEVWANEHDRAPVASGARPRAQPLPDG
jgi:peptidoglycan/LPS O-acetylase OafA/YrhL